MTKDNDPWNPMGSSPANQNKTNQADAFSGLQTNLHLGINGKSNLPSKANNDPWTTHIKPTDGPQEGQSMDPFSPVAQSQLAEFDILRDQMEITPNTTGTAVDNGNRGRFLFPAVRSSMTLISGSITNINFFYALFENIYRYNLSQSI